MILLLFSDALPNSPEPVGHQCADRDEVVCRPKAANGKVAAVLDWLVAARRRHVLRHCGGIKVYVDSKCCRTNSELLPMAAAR